MWHNDPVTRIVLAGCLLFTLAAGPASARDAGVAGEGDEIVAVVSADVPGFSETVGDKEAFHDDDFKRDLAHRTGERRRHEVITRRDLVRESWGFLRGDEPASPPEAARRRRQAEQKALEILVDQKILARAAIEQGFSISDREVDDEIIGRLRRNPAWGVRDIPEFARRLSEQGDTIERYRRETREGLLATYYEQYNVRSVEIAVSPARIRAWYEAHAGELALPAAARLTRVLIGTGDGDEARRKADARAGECLARLRSGADAAGVAREFSEDLETREAGGAAALVEEGSYPAAIEEAVYSGATGSWLGPVEAKGFLWIFRVEERRERSVMTLAEAQDRIRRRIVAEERQVRLTELLARARKGVYVWISPDLAAE